MIAAAAMALIGASAHAGLTDVRVTIENLAPEFGTYQTPFWVGFHNGQFDLFDAGAAASTSLERLAEDGETSFVSADFGFPLSNTMGVAEWTIDIPNNFVLGGLEFYLQALVLDLGVNPGGATVTNAVEGVIGIK